MITKHLNASEIEVVQSFVWFIWINYSLSWVVEFIRLSNESILFSKRVMNQSILLQMGSNWKNRSWIAHHYRTGIECYVYQTHHTVKFTTLSNKIILVGLSFSLVTIYVYCYLKYKEALWYFPPSAYLVSPNFDEIYVLIFWDYFRNCRPVSKG